MAKDKAQEAAQQAAPAPINVTVVHPTPKPADPIPGFDKTTEGGVFYVRKGNHPDAPLVAVNAVGEPIDKETLKAHLESKGEAPEDAKDDSPSK